MTPFEQWRDLLLSLKRPTGEYVLGQSATMTATDLAEAIMRLPEGERPEMKQTSTHQTKET